MAIGAHLDDVEIACGGLIARCRSLERDVSLLALSDSSYSNYDGTVFRTKEEAWGEAQAAARILGVTEANLAILHFPTKDIPDDSTVVEAIQERLDASKPDAILTHWPFDTHQAHRKAGLATLAAARYYTTVMMYEPMMPSARSHVAFRPQIYIDISDHIGTKLDALRAHESQYRKYGDDWIEAVKARSRLRGFEMGVEYAEAFEAVRFRWDP